MTSPFTIREEDAGFRVYCFSAGMYPIGSREDAERLKRSLDYEWARHNPTDDDIRSFLEVFDQRDQAIADLAKERERAEKAEAALAQTTEGFDAPHRIERADDECGIYVWSDGHRHYYVPKSECDALRAELAECRAKREVLRGAVHNQDAIITEMRDAKEAAEARAERLRKICTEILGSYRFSHSGSCCTFDTNGKVVITTASCQCEPQVKSWRVALAETANETSEANVAATVGDVPTVGQNLASPEIATSATRQPGTVSEGPGTSSPDDAERAAREWLDRWYGAGRLTVAHVKTLAALLVQAREAGRVEGWNEAVEACAKFMAPNNANAAAYLRALKRPDRAK